MTNVRGRPSKRIVLVGLWILIVASLFWTCSRYPDLGSKALIGGDAMLEDPLSFEAAFEIQGGDPVWRRIVFTTLNWLQTNEKGMLFGVLLGAGLLVLLNMLQSRGVKSSWGNTLLGMAMGAPLGVCVNCAAPIAKGVHHAGARLETTLAAMVSSPTLNVIVVTMMFSILPIYLAVTKLAFTLIFILFVIPLLAGTVFRSEVEDSLRNGLAAASSLTFPGPNESWWRAGIWVARDYARSLWFIVRTTVPLMFLAAVMGSVMVTLVPLTNVAKMGTGFIPAILLVVLGLFLPVPMAFDVIVSASLLAAGLPVFYVMILLFVLGIYSCYSAFIIGTTVSWRVSLVLFAVLSAMGLLAGAVGDAFHQAQIGQMVEFAEAEMRDSSSHTASADLSQVPEFTFEEKSRITPLEESSISVERSDDRPRSGPDALPFTRFDGDRIGLPAPLGFSAEDFAPPFFNGRGLSSADIDGDGWPDVVMATESGIRLYRNRRGKDFERIPLQVPGLERLNVFLAAPVDVDDDGSLDLYLTTYRLGNYVLLNRGGRFDDTSLHRVPMNNAVFTHAVSFADLEGDGDLDAMLGNWSYGLGKAMPMDPSANSLHRSKGGRFKAEPLAGPLGETLSVLFSDWSGDGQLDLVVGNDFEEPDVFYVGDEQGSLHQVERQDGLIPISTTSTMSVDTGDVNNDLSLEIYLTQIAAGVSTSEKLTAPRGLNLYCSDVEDAGTREFCERNVAIRSLWAFGAAHSPGYVRHCNAIEDLDERHDCRGMMLLQTATRERDPALCRYIPNSHERARNLCQLFFNPGRKLSDEEFDRSIPQTGARNVMLFREENGFRNRAEEMDVEVTGWSWNGKFGDLDNDEWQDIYVVNGTWLHPGKAPSNILFRNLKGERFRDDTQDFGLQDFIVVSAYTYVDFDRDGDLDIITNSVSGPIRVYRNNESQNHSVSVELRDYLGNRFGIGAKIVIHYASGGGPESRRHQIREIKSGGGFLSFDPLVAHFGLGKFEVVEQIEIQWPDGESTTVEGPFSAGARYRIERK